MSGKYRSKKEMQRIVDRFFDNCHQKGYPESLTGEYGDKSNPLPATPSQRHTQHLLPWRVTRVFS
jgi:hypothetical protein